MAAEESPAFQFYVKEWRSSRAVQRMTFGERGMYFEMLCEQWEALTLPDDPQGVAALIATSDSQTAEIVAAWPTLRRKFELVDGQPSRIQNLRLERVRREKRAFIRGAKKGGKTRAAQAARTSSGAFVSGTSRQPAASQPPPSRSPAASQPDTSTASSTATASSSSTATATHGASRSAGAPPLSLGLRRLKIWRWMVDEFIDRLGEHAEAFDLDAWIQQQDSTEQRVVGGNWGAYWSTAFDAEIRRRGIPLAASSDRKSMFTESAENEAKAVLAIVNQHGGVPR